MHHRLASNPVRCDLVLYVDSEIVNILSLYSLICLCNLSLSLFWSYFALLLLFSYDVIF